MTGTIVLTVFIMCVGFGCYYVGWLNGVRETEERWNNAVARADAERLAKTF